MTAKQRLLVIVVGMAGMVLVASAAFACANLVTINLSEDSATPGSTVVFRVDALRDDPAPDAEAPRAVSDVVVRWNGHDGQELARGRSVNRTLSGSLTIPDVPPGRYMILANQTYTDTGDPVPGAPARTTIEVTAAQASGAGVASQSTPSDTGAADAAPVAPAEEASAASQPAAPGAQTSSVPQESAATPPAAAQQPAAPIEDAAVSPRASAVSPSGAVSPSESSGATAGSTPTGAVAAPQQVSPAVSSATTAEQAARARFAAAERAAAAAGLHEVAAPPISHPAAERAAAPAQVAASTPQTTWWSALPGSAAAGWAVLALALAMAAALLDKRRHGLALTAGRLPL